MTAPAPTTKAWLRTAADRISIGSTRLAARTLSRTIRSVRTRVSTWPWWVQLPLAYVALFKGPALLARVGDRIHERVESGAWSGVLTALALLWIVVAYRAGGDQPEPDGQAPGDSDEAADEEAAAEPPLPLLVDLRISLARVGTPHAHLAALATDLATTPERVREALAKYDIPVQAVRMQGRGTSTGVKGDTHPALRPSPEDVVAAGQPSNNNSNNTPTAPLQKGSRVEHIGHGGRLVHNPADPVRHHQVGDH